MRNLSINELVTLAKGNNYDATMELWNRVSASVERTHEYGRVGTWRSRDIRSKYALTFEAASGDLYFVFLNCIKNFDASRGASFLTYLNYKVKMYANDHIRSQYKKFTQKGETVNVTEVNYDALQHLIDVSQDNGQDDSLDSAQFCYTDASEEISEEEATLYEVFSELPSGHTDLMGSYSPVYFTPAMGKVNEVMSLFETGSREREVLETYLKLARHTGETPTVREVGEKLGITGAAVCNRMAEVRKVLSAEGIRV